MAKRVRETETSHGGMTLTARFALFMSLALAGVMAITGFVLYTAAAKLTTTVQERTLIDAVRLTAENQRVQTEKGLLETERDLLQVIGKMVAAWPKFNDDMAALHGELRKMFEQRAERVKELERSITWKQVEDQSVFEFDSGRVQRYPIVIGEERVPAYLLRASEGVGENKRNFDLLAPATTVESERGLLGLIIGTTLVVIAVGALVSVLVASQVSGPIEAIAEDVRQIATGDLSHRTHARGVREVNQLARSIDRMTADLSAAQDARLELSAREREVALAGEVRESLLANETPDLPGWEFGALCLSSAELAGDFYDHVTAADGGVGLLVCDVSGRGIPGTLVGATARAYLRAELARGGDLREALFHVNRELARDVRRGMYVSAMYVWLDAANARARIACAGHKLPAVHWSAADNKLRLVQPEGIALGFDKGPIFESRLEIAEVDVAPGDRIVIFNSGPAAMVGANGAEFGEKNLFQQVLRHGSRPTPEFLERLRSVLEAFSEGAPLARDVSILTVRRA